MNSCVQDFAFWNIISFVSENISKVWPWILLQHLFPSNWLVEGLPKVMKIAWNSSSSWKFHNEKETNIGTKYCIWICECSFFLTIIKRRFQGLWEETLTIDKIQIHEREEESVRIKLTNCENDMEVDEFA